MLLDQEVMYQAAAVAQTVHTSKGINEMLHNVDDCDLLHAHAVRHTSFKKMRCAEVILP